ncbi:Fic family protein [Enhygromyxa salina]|uniref:Fic/DOC family protein n=1 Tax=Enhygromyxa salina TaxID=215803 RepID=A0A2S9Y2Y2_9BACT|nr:Fic family protein [Enhygromyxa salina]PRP99350.1 Fic/DOC family protein [Enhygromyxa salina]
MTERESAPEGAEPLPSLTDDEKALLEAENGIRQYDRMVALVEGALAAARFRLRVSALIELNRLAVEGLEVDPGSLRSVPIRISNTDHQPPPASDVPGLLEEMCDYVNDSWESRTALHLSAYVMWRLNWIHPWKDGNGRTSRVVSYLVLCAKTGFVLPGTTTIPEMIAGNKHPYYAALDAADEAWQTQQLDVSEMESLLADLLAKQLVGIYAAAGGPT